MSFRTALTGLNAATSDLGVISNNIANNNTTGFKTSRAEFADVLAGSKVGTGVKLAAVTQQFQQGSVSTTGNPLDMAVDGEGFFRIRDSSGISYTRAGSFGVDSEGNIVNNTGARLSGYQIGNNGNLTGALGDLRLPTGELQPSATTNIEYGINLDATEEVPTLAFDPTNADTYNYSTSLNVFDSLGGSHTLTIYFRKTAANAWELHGSLDGTYDKDATGTSTGTPHVSFTGAGGNILDFTTGGLLDAATLSNQPLEITVDLDAVGTELDTDNGAATPLVVNLDFTQSTQFGGQSSTNALSQDGYSSGRLGGVEVGEDGTLFGRYSNGQSRILGQVALVNFRNPQGLSPIGDTSWVESSSSGAPVPGAPGSAGLGQIRSASLEGSTVELTEQLVGMINAQRNFQANAQVISTNSEMTQTILNLR